MYKYYLFYLIFFLNYKKFNNKNLIKFIILLKKLFFDFILQIILLIL